MHFFTMTIYKAALFCSLVWHRYDERTAHRIPWRTAWAIARHSRLWD